MSSVGLNHRYFVRNLAIPPASFAPTDIPSLVAWYDASNAGSITASGGAVSQWNDLSGLGNHLTQGTGSSQPTTGTRTQNGLNVLDFDGLNDKMSVVWASLTQPNTAFVVCKFDVVGDNRFIFDGTGSSTRNTFFGGSTGKWGYYAGTQQDVGTSDTSVHQFTVTFNGTSSSLRVDAAGVGGTLDAGAQAWDDLVVGTNQASTLFHDGYICELFIANAATTGTNLTNAEGYLKAKWGTP